MFPNCMAMVSAIAGNRLRDIGEPTQSYILKQVKIRFKMSGFMSTSQEHSYLEKKQLL